MQQITCLEHHLATSAGAHALVAARDGGTWRGFFGFCGNHAAMATTKPYASQRPSGAPPG